MSSFNFRKNQENNEIKEIEEKSRTPFTMVFDIFDLLNKVKSKKEIKIKYQELVDSYFEFKDRFFVANLILKYSLYKNKGIEYNEDLVSVFRSMEPDIFILYFLYFCLENRIYFPPFLQYYNAGLMDSNTKYAKFFIDKIGEHNFEILRLELKDYSMSVKDLFKLVKENQFELES